MIKKKYKLKNKKLYIVISIVIIVIISFIIYMYIHKNKLINEIKNHYASKVIVTKNTKLYNKNKRFKNLFYIGK